MAEPAPVFADLVTGRAIRISERLGRTIVQIGAFHGCADAVVRALGAATGLEPSPKAGGTAGEGDLVILTVGPGRFWVVGEREIAGEIDPALALAVDQSHGRTVLGIEGDRVEDVLAKGCRIDLQRFESGSCAQTLLGPFAVLLHRLAPARFEIHVARSYAPSLRDWLLDAALEFESAARP